MALPTISVITPVKNGMPYLTDCLSSVARARGAGLEIEQIFVDGASTDGTLDLLATADGAKLFVRPELDAVNATVCALTQARGDLITFLMADDVLTDEFASLVQRVHAASPDFDLSLFACRRFHGEGDAASGAVMSPPRRIATVMNKYPGLNSALIRRTLMERVTIPIELRLTNDRPTMLRLWAKAREIVLCDAPLAAMRTHEGSATSSGKNDERVVREFAQAARQLEALNRGLPGHGLFALQAWRRALASGVNGQLPPWASLAALPNGWIMSGQRADALVALAPEQDGVQAFRLPFDIRAE